MAPNVNTYMCTYTSKYLKVFLVWGYYYQNYRCFHVACLRALELNS